MATSIVPGTAAIGSGNRPSPTTVVPLRLLQSGGPCEQTVLALRRLLADAEAGHIVGIAYAAVSRSNEFFYGFQGKAHRNPDTGMALAATLEHGAKRRVFGDD